MNNRSGKLSTTTNRRSIRNIESKIGRYIRGEISADLIHKSNVQLTARDESQQLQNQQQYQNAADHSRSKTRPPFRNMINVKNTSFLSAVSDMKRLKLNDSKEAAVVVVQPLLAASAASSSGGGSVNGNSSSITGGETTDGRVCLCLAEPDVQGVCICDLDILRKFVPEPGVYVQTLKRKLTDVRSRNAEREAIFRELSRYDLDVAAMGTATVAGINDDRNFEIWQCN